MSKLHYLKLLTKFFTELKSDIKDKDLMDSLADSYLLAGYSIKASLNDESDIARDCEALIRDLKAYSQEDIHHDLINLTNRINYGEHEIY